MKNILIVCHGPNRGRQVPTLVHALDYVRQENPALYSRIKFYQTGSSSIPNLESYSAIWFWLSDPLKERYPDCYRDAKQLVEAAGKEIRLINPPDNLSNTIKSVQAEILRKAGFHVAQHGAFENLSQLEGIIESFPFPAILRADLSHSLRGLFLLENQKDFHKINKPKLQFPGTLVEFVDTRKDYKKINPGTVWSRLFHKKRSIVLGRKVDRRSVLFSTSPIVKLRTCMYQGPSRIYFNYRLPSPMEPMLSQLAQNLPFRGWRAKCIEADNGWWEFGDEDETVLVGAAKSLGLDCAAFDYSTTADGGIVIWEANPYFYMPLKENYLLATHRKYDQRRLAANRAFSEFLNELANTQIWRGKSGDSILIEN